MTKIFKRAGSIRPYSFMMILMLASIVFSAGCEEKQRVKSGDAAPVFSARDVNGELVTLGQFTGDVVVLYFWTNSCCGDRLKQIEPVYVKHKQKGLALLAINVGDSGEAVKSYAQSNGLTFTMLTDERSKIFKQYGAIGFPTVFILDGNGIIRKKILGDIQAAQLEKLVEHQFTIKKETDAAYEKMHRR
jgi:peroxiredoxin